MLVSSFINSSEADLEDNDTQFMDLARTGRHKWWTFLLGLSIVIISTAVASFIGKLMLHAWADGHSSSDPIYWLIVDRSFEKIAVLFSLFLVIRILHQRPFRSLVAGGDHISWKQLIQGFALYFLVFSVTLLADYFVSSSNPQFGIRLPRPADTLLTIPLQIVIFATAEEMLFRGYILQALGLLTRNRVVLALIAGLIFMGAHMADPAIASLFLVFEVGFFLAIITLKSNGLELAIGMHIGHNLAGRLINYSTLYQPVYLPILFPICAAVVYLIIFRRKAEVHPETEDAKDVVRSFHPASE
jgi:membrane protease YdiL (CAAX protease family)